MLDDILNDPSSDSQATMGLIYFMFLALNKDNGSKGGGDGPKGGGGAPPMDDPAEEARKIMEKYK